MRKSLLVAILALPVAATAAASQQVALTANVGWVSEYIFRGIPQNSSSASAGMDATMGALTLGTWGADVGDGNEVDVYGKVGFGTGKFRFAPDWASIGPYHQGLPALPDHMDTREWASAEHPFRLVTSPARSFLNSTFAETPTSRKREGKPKVAMHPDDAGRLGLQVGDRVRLGNRRGELVTTLALAAGQQPGVLIAEGLWRDEDFEDGRGINHLTGADPVPPNGGVGFHDTAVWVRPAN